MAAGEYHVRGPVPIESDAYVDRPFIEQCFDEVSRGNWVVLLGPRQHGKTSGLNRLAARLEEQGFVVPRVSLQAMPPLDRYEDVLRWLARQMARQTGVQLIEPAVDDAMELDAWLAAALPPGPGSCTVILDEASGIADEATRARSIDSFGR